MIHNLENVLASGQTALEEGRHAEAAQAFDQVRAAIPDNVTVCQMAAQAWRLARDTVRERDAWRGAYAVRQAVDIPTLFEIGSGLLLSGAPFEARECLETVAAARARDSAALGALAAACRSTGHLPEAWRLVTKALALSPRSPTLCLTAAQIRHSQGNLADAHRWLDKAEKLRPSHGPTKLQRGLTWLLSGPSAAGWEGFEARGLPACPTGARPWHGEPLTGQSIVVLAEQGLGDLFHFLRFIPLLHDRGATRVVIEAPPSTHRLLIANGFTIVSPGALPETDWYVPLLSLPHRLGTDSDHHWPGKPYLSVGSASEAVGQPSASRPRFGVSWKGNPAFLATALRDLDSHYLPALSGVADAEWLSLQIDEPCPPEFSGMAGPIGDWLDTARGLHSLDCVISIDTAVAHLAGAMGLPTLVLLPYSPDWRWGMTGDRTPWYPTARLVRQQAPRDWPSAIALAAQLLANL
jgi:hypothetical protein